MKMNKMFEIKGQILDLLNLLKNNGRKLKRRISVNLKQEYCQLYNNLEIIQLIPF